MTKPQVEVNVGEVEAKEGIESRWSWGLNESGA